MLFDWLLVVVVVEIEWLYIEYQQISHGLDGVQLVALVVGNITKVVDNPSVVLEATKHQMMS